MKKYGSLQSRASLQQRIALVILGIFLFFVFLETSLRLGELVLLSMQEHRNLQSIKQKGAYRILCLGESTTQGQYPPFLEQALNQRKIGVCFSTIDKGRISTNTPTILSKVESYLAEYHPDMVVAMMGVNDPGKHIPYEAPTASKTMFLIRSFKTYKFSRFLWLHILTKAKEMGLYKLHEDKQRSPYPGKIATRLPETGSKEDYVEPSPAEKFLDKAIELKPKDYNAYLELGHFYQDQGKFTQAEDAFKQAIEFNPKNGDAYIELGWLYFIQGRFSSVEYAFQYSQAEDAFKQAVELNPENERVYFEIGRFYRHQKKFTQAEDAFKKARELSPKDHRIYLELGQLYQHQGKITQAKDAFEKVIEFNPENDEAYRAISVLDEEIGRPDLAKEYAEKAKRLILGYYIPVTVNSYRRLKEILDKKKIRLVCVQYPMRNLEPLKRVFKQDEGVIFVDNENVFKEAVKKASYQEYFTDMFGGDFGHCTDKGNKLLAENIANVILKEVFNK
jgi:Tfp pilus assembly protein PilF